MKKIKMAIALLLAICLGFCSVACKRNESSGNSGTQSGVNGGYSSSTEENYDDTVNDWQENGSNQGDFDNTVNNDTPTPTPTPGQTEDDLINLNKPEKDEDETEDDSEEVKKHFFDVSELADPNSLQFYYEGSCYAFGIDAEGKECIAFKSAGNELLDVLRGAGKFELKTSSGLLVAGTGQIISFKQTMKDAFDALIIDYAVAGLDAATSTIQYTYVFKENCISVSAHINANTNRTIAASTSNFNRFFLTDYLNEQHLLNSEWVYPENGDYPYEVFESLCFRTQLTEYVYLYSFQRGEGIRTEYSDEKWSSAKMPLTMEDSQGLFYTHEYDITFVDTLYENKEGTDYRGLFKGLNSDFAAGVSPVKATDDDSTLFIGNSVDLNINITNLTDDDLTFSLRYDVRDYYGNIVSKGLFINSTAYQYTSANRTINVSGKYGIYYLNLYVISRYSTYVECYPFALLEDYTYKYNATSPWGLTSPNTKNDTEGRNTGRLFAKVGVSNFRINPIYRATYEECMKLGITRFNTLLGKNHGEQTEKAYMATVIERLEDEGDVTLAVENGNESNLEVIGGTTQEIYDRYVAFYKNMFVPVYKYMRENYPNLKYIPSPFSAGQQEWIDCLTTGVKVDNDGDGIKETTLAEPIWDKIDAVSTHIYGTPWMPDNYGTYKPAYKTGLWHIEAALQRLDECLIKYSKKDKTEKDLYITEVGYATYPGIDTSIDLRTQADYNVRSGILCAAYGADNIQFYSTFNKKTWGSGYDPVDKEWNFGAFYQHDYYGRIKPKPWGVAYANLTRVLESYEKDSMYIYDKYDEGYDKAGVRAFKCKTALNGDVVIAWSNYEVLSNGKKDAASNTGLRVPNLPWNNQWQKVDEIVFDAKSDTVTAIDLMGNKTTYKVKDGKVTIPLSGSPVYLLGVK